MVKKILAAIFLLLLMQSQASAWGFFAHKRINKLAVFGLPPEMMGFFKYHIVYLAENAVNPDRRRNVVKDEAPRHYIDIDVYGDSALYKMPRRWDDAVKKYTKDTLMAYGIVPWHVNLMKYSLTKAFRDKDAKAILRLAADIGHYIADANVPLHTTENYNGQLTNQRGIHGFWESRLPELFSDKYDYFVGKADYVSAPQTRAWAAVTQAHLALDSVLGFERELTNRFSPDKKYAFEQRGTANVQVYSREFSAAYHEMLAGQVERRLRASVKMVSDFWYTCWVDAGQPNLDALLDIQFTKEEQKQMEKEREEWEKQEKAAKVREEACNRKGVRGKRSVIPIFDDSCCGHSHLAHRHK